MILLVQWFHYKNMIYLDPVVGVVQRHVTMGIHWVPIGRNYPMKVAKTH